MYRYRRLDEARAAAREDGYKGAMYPWQSGSDGQEETQVVHLNPKFGQVGPGPLAQPAARKRRHLLQHLALLPQVTDDFEFLLDDAAEMMLEIARFWSSIAHYNEERDRYEIHGVMGPDEFHEKYPGSDEEGLRNNAYTNVMVAWICEVVQQVLELLPRAQHRDSLIERIGLSDEEIETWSKMSHKMFVPVPRRPGARRRHHQPIRRLRKPRRAKLGALPRKIRQDTAPGPHPAGRRGRPGQIQARQTGRHPHALLPLLTRRAGGGLR